MACHSIFTTIGGALISFMTVYSTPKIVQVKNKKIAVFNRTVQLALFSYILGFMIIYKKGYQVFSPIESAVVTKIKGTTEVNLTGNQNINENFDSTKLDYYNRIWDSQDIVNPPKEPNGFFLTTNLVITKNQSLGTCPDWSGKTCDPSKQPEQCKKLQSVLSDGKNTGNCVFDNRKSRNATVCEIKGWCPSEDDTLVLKNNESIFKEIQNFTVLIKNTIRFSLFNILKRNIEEESDLGKCLFDVKKDPRCPIFRIGDIISDANVDFDEISRLGGVIGIQINWNCDLDWSLKDCFPTYTFTRIDLKNASLSPGYNFRYSRYNSFNGQERRDLFKAYGIKFEILASGQGGKFSAQQLAINIGSGVGLLALATLVCDFVMLYFTTGKEVYNQKKYLYVTEESLTAVQQKQKQKAESISDSVEFIVIIVPFLINEILTH